MEKPLQNWYLLKLQATVPIETLYIPEKRNIQCRLKAISKYRVIYSQWPNLFGAKILILA